MLQSKTTFKETIPDSIDERANFDWKAKSD